MNLDKLIYFLLNFMELSTLSIHYFEKNLFVKRMAQSFFFFFIKKILKLFIDNYYWGSISTAG